MLNSTLFLISSGLIVVAGAIPDSFPIPAAALQGGASLSLTWTVWYMLARTFPAHLKAMKDQRDAFLEHLKESK